jgi:hypothetical protein
VLDEQGANQRRAPVVYQGLVKRGGQEHMSTAKSNRVCCGYSDAFASIAVAGFFGLTQTDPFAQFLVNVAYPLSNYPPQPPGFQSAPLALSALRTDFICACSLRDANLLLS